MCGSERRPSRPPSTTTSRQRSSPSQDSPSPTSLPPAPPPRPAAGTAERTSKELGSAGRQRATVAGGAPPAGLSSAARTTSSRAPPLPPPRPVATARASMSLTHTPPLHSPLHRAHRSHHCAGRSAMASPTESLMGAAPLPAAQQLLPDEILEDIFLRLDSGPDLARASAACHTFRRIVTGRRFLRRFTSLHPPPFIGFFDVMGTGYFRTGGFVPVQPPHRSAPAARALAQAADFAFSFLPSPSWAWRVHDVRDGRFLLCRDSLRIVVCDPLFRRYVQIPPIPGDLVPTWPQYLCEIDSELFLAPPGDEEESGEDSHFRVICNWRSTDEFVSCVFSMVTGKWCGPARFNFSPARLFKDPKKLVCYYARSCFYWALVTDTFVLVLDPREMKFSTFELLHGHSSPLALAIMDAQDDRLGYGLVTLGLDCCWLHLGSRTCQNNGDGAGAWRHDKSIRLPESESGSLIVGAAEGYLLLLKCPNNVLQKKTDYLAVDLKTSLVERLCSWKEFTFRVRPYARFPPPLSLPSL